MIAVHTEDWMGILVYLECQNGTLLTVGLELLGEAERLAKQKKMDIYAVAIGQNLDGIEQSLIGFPIAKLYLYETVDTFHIEIYQKTLIRCIQRCMPEIVLIGGTREGRALAPGVAVAFGSGLTADCTAFEMNEKGNLVQIRPAFGGNIMARILTEHTRPQFATVRPGMMQVSSQRYDKMPSVFRESVLTIGNRIQIQNVYTKPKADTITEQKVLVAVGRGIRHKEDLAMFHELAESLGGKLACSRALVEKGWMPAERQIGLSGNSVAPEYLLTFGISGTVQFMAGMRNAKNIIAVNRDANAPIFRIAHYPICSDLYDVANHMLAQLKQKGADLDC